jgi:hypothetical protein
MDQEPDRGRPREDGDDAVDADRGQHVSVVEPIAPPSRGNVASPFDSNAAELRSLMAPLFAARGSFADNRHRKSRDHLRRNRHSTLSLLFAHERIGKPVLLYRIIR